MWNARSDAEVCFYILRSILISQLLSFISTSLTIHLDILTEDCLVTLLENINLKWKINSDTLKHIFARTYFFGMTNNLM